MSTLNKAQMKWNEMVRTLFRVCRIQWHCSLFLFWNTLFGQIWSKNKIISLSWNVAFRLIRICRIHWGCSLFQKHPFWANLVQKVKIDSLSWNSVSRLKESIQKQLLTEQIFFEIGVLKNFAMFRAKYLNWSMF